MCTHTGTYIHKLMYKIKKNIPLAQFIDLMKRKPKQYQSLRGTRTTTILVAQRKKKNGKPLTMVRSKGHVLLLIISQSSAHTNNILSRRTKGVVKSLFQPISLTFVHFFCFAFFFLYHRQKPYILPHTNTHTLAHKHPHTKLTSIEHF